MERHPTDRNKLVDRLACGCQVVWSLMRPSPIRLVPEWSELIECAEHKPADLRGTEER